MRNGDWKVAYVAAVIVLLCQGFGLNFVYTATPENNTILELILLAVLPSIGIYTGLYIVLLQIWHKFLWRYFTKNSLINGKWNLQIIDTDGGLIREGFLWVKQSDSEIEIWGRNFSPKVDGEPEKNVKTWRAEHISLVGSTLNYTYRVNDAGTGAKVKIGTTDVVVSGDGVELDGRFYDHSPSRSFGTVAYRLASKDLN